jgi:hypothetical protein
MPSEPGQPITGSPGQPQNASLLVMVAPMWLSAVEAPDVRNAAKIWPHVAGFRV